MVLLFPGLKPFDRPVVNHLMPGLIIFIFISFSRGGKGSAFSLVDSAFPEAFQNGLRQSVEGGDVESVFQQSSKAVLDHILVMPVAVFPVVNRYMEDLKFPQCFLIQTAGLHITLQSDVETRSLYQEALRKFEIFHIAIDDREDCYRHYENMIKNSFGRLLKDRFYVSTLDRLPETILKCLRKSGVHQGKGAALTAAGKRDENENDQPRHQMIDYRPVKRFQTRK